MIDPSPFASIPLPGPPPLSSATTQRSAPSELQTFVREVSKIILADFRPFVSNDLDGTQDAEADAADEKRLAELVRHGKNQVQSTGKVDVTGPAPTRRGVGSGLRLKDAHGTVTSDSKHKIEVDKHDQKPPQLEPM